MVRIPNSRPGGGGAERVRRRAEARRLGILRAAARVFRAKGFAQAGMRDIAAEADLSPGNLYHYFAGKEELLYFCQDRSLDRMLEAVRAVAGRPGPMSARLRRVFEVHARVLLDEMEGSSAHLEVDALPPLLRRKVVAKRDRYERAIRGLIEEGIASGEFEAQDAGLVTRAALGALNWSARWFDPAGRRSAAEVAAGLADYLVRGLERGRPPIEISSRSPRSGDIA